MIYYIFQIDAGKQVLEILSKNNDKLRKRQVAMITQMEQLEEELHNMQNQNHCLEKQIRNYNTETQNYKGTEIFRLI